MIHDLFEYSISQQFIKDHFYIFVVSFSENGDLLSQWRAYCPENSGFNIGFDLKLIQDVVNKQGFFISRCLYDPEEQKAAIKHLFKQWGLLYIENMGSFSALAKENNIDSLTDCGDGSCFRIDRCDCPFMPFIKTAFICRRERVALGIASNFR